MDSHGETRTVEDLKLLPINKNSRVFPPRAMWGRGLVSLSGSCVLSQDDSPLGRLIPSQHFVYEYLFIMAWVFSMCDKFIHVIVLKVVFT